MFGVGLRTTPKHVAVNIEKVYLKVEINVIKLGMIDEYID